MAYQDVQKLTDAERERIEAVRKFGLAKAEELYGKNEIDDLIGKTGLTGDQTEIANFLKNYDIQGGYTPATNYVGGVLDGSNPYVNQTGQYATDYANFLNSQGTGQPGLTQPMSFAQDRAKDIMGTQGKAGLNELVDAQVTAGDVISTGGFTPELNKMARAGYGLLNSGGFTDELQSFMGSMAGMIGGYTGPSAEASRAFNAAMNIVDAGGEGGSLIPIEQMISFARDEAANANRNSGNAAIREFVRRGGSFGAGVGTGGPLAEFADQAAQNEAKALRDTSLGAQDLRLQREMGALGAAGQLGSSIESSKGQQESTRIGAMGSLASAGVSYAGNAMRTGADLVGSANSTAANMYNTSMQGMSNFGNIFADREQNAFNNSIALNTAANQNVTLGAGLSRAQYTNGVDAANIYGGLTNMLNTNQLNFSNSAFEQNQTGVNNQFALQKMYQDQADAWLQDYFQNGYNETNMTIQSIQSAMAKQPWYKPLVDMGYDALGAVATAYTPKALTKIGLGTSG